MEHVRLEDLTAQHIHRCGAVCVEGENHTAVVVRQSRKLAPMIAASAPAPTMPEDLLVEVPDGTVDPIETVRSALEYLGFGSVLH